MAGTGVSGAYPAQRDGTSANPPGTAATRALDPATGSNLSAAYPQNNKRCYQARAQQAHVNRAAQL